MRSHLQYFPRLQCNFAENEAIHLMHDQLQLPKLEILSNFKDIMSALSSLSTKIQQLFAQKFLSPKPFGNIYLCTVWGILFFNLTIQFDYACRKSLNMFIRSWLTSKEATRERFCTHIRVCFAICAKAIMLYFLLLSTTIAILIKAWSRSHALACKQVSQGLFT